MTRETIAAIDACLDSSISAGDFQALQESLRHDPAALDHWCRQAEIHGRLEWELAPSGTPASSVTPRRRRTRLAPAAAALVLLGLGLGLTIPWPATLHPLARVTPEQPPMPPRAALVARLTSAEGARWSGDSPIVDEWISAGRLDLLAGSALITFDCGATVQLNGPARFHLTSATRSFLESGEAYVNITRQAYGFVFETPTAEICRRMSRFHATVDEAGQTRLRIDDGEVQVAGKMGDLKILNVPKNRGIQIDRSGTMLPLAPADFFKIPTRLPENPDLLPDWFLHWSFDTADATNGVFLETGRRQDLTRPAFHAQVRSPRPDAAVALVPGRFGNAITMNGQLAFLATECPGIAGTAPRSVALWVKIDPDTPDALAYAMMSWGTLSTSGGKKWQISWNTGIDNPGAHGAIRTEVEGGYQIGSTNLLTGTWHHVVSVFSGGDGADISRNLRHYVDGRLEAVTATRSHSVATVTDEPSSLPVTIGRRIEKEGIYRSFRGELDEIYLFPCALTPEQVDSLYRQNHPPVLRQ